MLPIRLNQLRPSVPPQTPFEVFDQRLSPAGDAAMIDILESRSY